MEKVNLVFPHQLFYESPLLDADGIFVLVEEHLFFQQYNFHKIKLAYHRASMKTYQGFLKEKGLVTRYIDSFDEKSDIRKLLTFLANEGTTTLRFIDPTDDWLEKRIASTAQELGLRSEMLNSPGWLKTKAQLGTFFKPEKKSFFQTTYYKQERKRLNILLEDNGEPVGGKWTYDSDNRKKYPEKRVPPVLHYPEPDARWEEACLYVEQHFPNNLGQLTKFPLYPTSRTLAFLWLQEFLRDRFEEFGPYEDAIVYDAVFLHHSVLTPMLNVGILTPQEVLDEALSHGEENEVPLNSLEGFVRQIIGWREFIRGMYVAKGTESRTKNYWGFTRKIPDSFYSGTTGVLPVDNSIRHLKSTAYTHHIERLMVIGNFMLLCEFDPDEVYRWFMEFYIDSYDWVMVPNVYGMSQFADGGFFATKPYISGSNYLMKMSDYPNGSWQQTWDALFWRFMHVHRSFFSSNPRLNMLVSTFDKMDIDKQNKFLTRAEEFLHALDQPHQLQPVDVS